MSSNYLTNFLVIEPKVSAPLITKPAIVHDSDPIPSTSQHTSYSSHLLLDLTGVRFPKKNPAKMYRLAIRAKFPTHRSLLDFTTAPKLGVVKTTKFLM